MKAKRNSNERDTKPTSVPAPAGARTSEATTMGPAGEEAWQEIAVAAYFRAEKRGFAPGRELDDWLAAEAERRSRHE